MTAILVIGSSSVIAQTPKAVQQVQRSQENIMTVNSRPEIIGLWGMEIQNQKQCTEYYNFRGSNEVVINSAKEWSTGLYDYRPSPDNTHTTLPVLIIQVVYDNNEIDCSGNKQDQSKEINQFFVKWNSPNNIEFCMTEKGEHCLVTLNRVLP